MPPSPKKLSLGDCAKVRDTCLALTLRSADRLVAQIYDGELRPHGIKSTQFTVMVAMRLMQPVPISRLAGRLKVDRTTLTRNLDLLERDGFVAIGSSEDLRERHLSLTVKGETAIAEAFPAWESAQRKMGELAGEKTVQELVTALAALADRTA